MDQCFQKEYKSVMGHDAFSDPFGFSGGGGGGKGGKKGNKGPTEEELLELKRLGMTDFKSKGRGGSTSMKGGGKGRKGDRKGKDDDDRKGKGKKGKRDDDDYVPDELRHYVIGVGGKAAPQAASSSLFISSTKEKDIKKCEKTLKDIDRLEKMVEEGKALDKDQQKKLESKAKVAEELTRLVNK